MATTINLKALHEVYYELGNRIYSVRQAVFLVYDRVWVLVASESHSECVGLPQSLDMESFLRDGLVQCCTDRTGVSLVHSDVAAWISGAMSNLAETGVLDVIMKAVPQASCALRYTAPEGFFRKGVQLVMRIDSDSKCQQIFEVNMETRKAVELCWPVHLPLTDKLHHSDGECDAWLDSQWSMSRVSSQIPTKLSLSTPLPLPLPSLDDISHALPVSHACCVWPELDYTLRSEHVPSTQVPVTYLSRYEAVQQLYQLRPSLEAKMVGDLGIGYMWDGTVEDRGYFVISRTVNPADEMFDEVLRYFAREAPSVMLERIPVLKEGSAAGLRNANTDSSVQKAKKIFV